MAGMNIQQRTAETLSPPGQSAKPDVSQVPRHQWLRAHEESLAVTYEHVGVGIAEIDHLRTLRNRDIRTCIDNLVALDKHHSVLNQRARFSIEQSRCLQRDDLISTDRRSRRDLPFKGNRFSYGRSAGSWQGCD
jgi:hypothetical protein